MTLKEFQAWILNHDFQDSWWVAIDGEVQDDLMALPDVSRLKAHHPLTKISLLHVSKSEEENAEWETFESDGPSVFKVTRDNNAGLGNFKQIPAKSKETSTPAAKEPEEAQVEEPPAKMSKNGTPHAAATPSRANVGDRAKQFFERQKKKEEPAKAQAVDDEALTSNAEFLKLKEEVRELKKELAEMRELMEDLKRPVSEARAMLEEREQFLEMSENSLFEKAQKQEVLQTELAQKSEELDTRERAIETREKALAK